MIVPTPVPFTMVAPVAADSRSSKVSMASSVLSPVTSTSTVLEVRPLAIVSFVVASALSSLPPAAVTFAVA